MEDRLAPPAPRVPSAARALPPRGALADFHAPADRVLDALHDIVDGAFAAVREVSSSRPGGDTYRQAEQEAIAAGDPTPLADLIRGDADRVASATVLARTAVSRQDEARAKAAPAMAKAADALRKRRDELEDAFASAAVEAWTARETGAGMAALDRATAILDESRTVAALLVWVRASDEPYDVAGRSAGFDVSWLAAHYAATVARQIGRGGGVPIEHPGFFTKDVWPAGWAEFSQAASRRHLEQAR